MKTGKRCKTCRFNTIIPSDECDACELDSMYEPKQPEIFLDMEPTDYQEGYGLWIKKDK